MDKEIQHDVFFDLGVGVEKNYRLK